MTVPLSQLLVPEQIFAGRYRIARFLAHGGNGAVYAAEQLSTEALVAIKVLPPNAIEAADALERFQFEAKVSGRVRSEFIVQVLDVGVEAGSAIPYLVMELLEGSSLADHVKTMGPLGFADTAAIFLQIGQGLDKAHRYTNKEGVLQPIVHRDLKPENLFLTVREDGHRAVKILDFGLAKVLSDSVVASQAVRGTPLYMSYEQLTSGPVSPQTDIWALGLIAFFLLTGRSYWRSANASSRSVAAVLAEILSAPIVAPSQRARELGLEPTWPAAFDAWFLRCVQRDPRARIEVAGDAASELASSLLGVGWSQTLPTLSVPSAAGVPAFGETAASLGSESTLDAQALSVGSTSPQPNKTLRSRPSPSARRRFLTRAALVVLAVGVLVVVGRLPAPSQNTRVAPSSGGVNRAPSASWPRPSTVSVIERASSPHPPPSATPAASASISPVVTKQTRPSRKRGTPVRAAPIASPAPWVYGER